MCSQPNGEDFESKDIKEDGQASTQTSGRRCSGNMGRARGWVFTFFPDDGSLIVPSWNSRSMNYLSYVRQICPDTKRPHIQGYVQYKSLQPKVRATESLKLGEKKFFIEQQKGSAKQADEYVTEDKKKTNVEPVTTFGIRDDSVGPTILAKGKRTDLQEVRKEIEESKLTWNQCCDKWPELVARYKEPMSNWVTRAANTQQIAIKEQFEWMTNTDKWVPSFLAMDYLSKPNIRDMFYGWSYEGRVGKTTFAKWLTNKLMEMGKTVFNTKSGRDVDLAFLYRGEQVVILDVPRGDKAIPYNFIESFLDGMVVSTKYLPERKVVPKDGGWVFMLTNIEPLNVEFSQDRLKKVNFNDYKI